VPFSSFADDSTLHIDPQKEIEILESLDIDPLFYNDEHYVKMKENISQLKKIYFLKTLRRGSLFMPNLQELLNESDIPNTFLYMAMVESKFLADSKSHKHAAGLWQFMPATAKEYKLAKSREVDERLDPIKSTKAAIEYLKYLHTRFKKWYLAAMAYNCGESRLAQGLKKAGTDDLAILLDEQKGYLPKETRDYIKRIIIAALLAHDENIIKKNNSNHLFGFCSNKKLTKLYFKGGESLQSIAFKIGVPYKKLKACNPHLIKERLPKNRKMYYVYLPEDLAQKAKERIKNSGESFVYYVQPNDTLFRISKRFNIKLSALRELNPHLAKHKVLKIGMPLTILGKPPKDLPQTAIAKPKKKHKVETYITQKETSLYELSLKFNNKLSALKKLNPDIKKHIPKGTKVKIITSYKKEENNETNQSKTPVKLTESFKTKSILTENNNTHKKEENTSKLITKNNEKNTSVALHETNQSSLLEKLEKKSIQEDNKTSISKTAQTDKNNSLPKPEIQPPKYKTITYIVEEGDYIEKIAMKLKVKAKELLQPGNVLIFKIKVSPKVIDTNNTIQSTKIK